jgi:hypothetical protein
VRTAPGSRPHITIMPGTTTTFLCWAHAQQSVCSTKPYRMLHHLSLRSLIGWYMTCLSSALNSYRIRFILHLEKARPKPETPSVRGKSVLESTAKRWHGANTANETIQISDQILPNPAQHTSIGAQRGNGWMSSPTVHEGGRGPQVPRLPPGHRK